jgi:glycosyltransferase involved in cell wall biosynthesis
MTLVEQLQERGWTVGLAADVDPRDPGHPDLRWLVNRTSFFPVPARAVDDHAASLRRAASTIRQLWTATRTFQPSVIHYHSLSRAPYVALLRLRHEAPIVATCHIEFNPSRYRVRGTMLLNQCWPGFLGDRVVAVSRTMESLLTRDLGVPSSRVVHIPHGVDASHFRPPTDEEARAARAAFDLPHDAPVVALVGRLDPVKGHDVLFHALRQLADTGLTVHAVCAGEGGFASEIEADARETGVRDHVSFPGHVDPRSVYWAADVNVLPSRREGFALVVPEAMLCGIPTIRTPAAGAQDQIDDGRNGRIVPFDAPRALADRLRHLLTHAHERREMGQEALRTAHDRFTEPHMVDATERLYTSLLPIGP